jgi:F420H(2)-dependent quinone reductase
MAKNELTGRPFPRRTAQVQRLITAIHVWFYQKTRGKIGQYIGKIPTLLLTTSGRKSGKQYVTPLTYARDGERLILIASNGGTAGDPQWWRNLQASPETAIQIGSEILHVRGGSTARATGPVVGESARHLSRLCGLSA